MKKAFKVLHLILVMAVLSVACSDRRSEQAEGRETELAGDEPDETPITSEQQVVDYNPADTAINITQEELPAYLRKHLQVLISTYLDIGEALISDSAEVAKTKANQLIDVLERHEQENMELKLQVKTFYTNAAHIIRQNAQNILSANELWEIRASFSAMAPAAYKLAKVADFSTKSLYYQYCSQSFDNRGAYWLSRSKEIRNPYAEQEKKNCGETVAIL